MDPLLNIARARLGRVLRGRWTLEEVLGVGGMATVYRARHRNGAAVAIKMLHPELTIDRSLRDRFLREGYMANRVGHEGAVKVLDDDVDDVDGTAFLVMELLEGETVEHRWKRKGERLPASEVLSIAYHAADVLVAAHEQGLVHRDMKPENLFLTRAGVLKILDFGVARLRERQGDVQATLQGAALGTPAFMPPEQARGRWNLVDGRSDVWSLGATMYTLLSGQWVHERETAAEQIIASATEPAPSLMTVAPLVASAVASVVDRALRHDMADRYQDMAAMRLALQEAASGPTSERVHLPQATFLGKVPADATERTGGATPSSNRTAELLDALSDEDLQTRVLDAGAMALRAADGRAGEFAVSGVSALRLPSLDSNPTASEAPLVATPHGHVTTSGAMSSTQQPRRRTNRRAAVLGLLIALLGILVALVIAALRTNYPPMARVAPTPLSPRAAGLLAPAPATPSPSGSTTVGAAAPAHSADQ